MTLFNRYTTYQYIKIDNEGRHRYFCLQQNPLVLGWVLNFKINTFRPNAQSESESCRLRSVGRWFWGIYKIFRKNLLILVSFARVKYLSRRVAVVVDLPFYGQQCMSVHQGYKIFDFVRGRVTKVFDHDVDTCSISNEIKTLENISHIDFAPSLKKWNVEDRWFEEEYINGTLDSSCKPLDSSPLLSKFYQEIAPCLEGLALFKKPMTVNAMDYISNIVKVLKVSRLSKQESTVREFNKINNFINSMVESLAVEPNASIHLVFAHGDFCPANILNTRKGIRVIDWEGAKYRTPAFDFYSYFFFRPVCRKIPVATIVSEVHDAFQFYTSKLSRSVPEISNSLLDLERVYRWIYYIEQICDEVKREMTYTQLNLTDFILGYIDAFNLYEELIEGNVRRISEPEIKSSGS